MGGWVAREGNMEKQSSQAEKERREISSNKIRGKIITVYSSMEDSKKILLY